LLIAPIRELLVAPRILLIPYGVLHRVPFHALWDGEHYWLEQVEVSYVPSASIAVYRRRGPSDHRLESFAGFAPYDERIPQAQAEIESAATFFSVARNYHNEAATVTNVTDAASTSDVLHLATHGLFRPDNSFFSALKLADGWLDVREIYRLPLRARLVVLSACESGVGQVRAGDEVVGLARGFLAAGTQSLIASLWNVHDRSAAELMAFFYRTLQGNRAPEDQPVRPAAALRAAQLHSLRSIGHPYFWAPFFAIG
jgi:CHAT domain-containing protein